MGNNIVLLCPCWAKESQPLMSDIVISDIEENEQRIIKLKTQRTLSFFLNNRNDNETYKSLVLIQNVFRQYKANKMLQNELKIIIERFDEDIKTNGSYINIEEMKQKLAYIDNLEHDKIGIPFKLTRKEMQMFPLIFNKPPIKLKDNSIYKGSWNYKGEKHGHGILYHEDGSKIEGIWKNNIMNGRGRFIDRNGNYFEGKWNKGIIEGEGKYVLANGSKYEGQWKNDVQEGFGNESFLDGSYYEGYYKNGKKEGFGSFTWINGSYYKGSFSESTMEGEGLFKWKNGRQYEGQWKNNQLNGYGTFIWPNGKKYIGKYRNSKKEGKGTYYWNENTYYKGFWLNNNQHGEGEFYCNGIITKGFFRYGKLIKCSSKNANDFNNQEQILNESSHRNTKCNNISSSNQPFLFE